MGDGEFLDSRSKMPPQRYFAGATIDQETFREFTLSLVQPSKAVYLSRAKAQRCSVTGKSDGFLGQAFQPAILSLFLPHNQIIPVWKICPKENDMKFSPQYWITSPEMININICTKGGERLWRKNQLRRTKTKLSMA